MPNESDTDPGQPPLRKPEIGVVRRWRRIILWTWRDSSEKNIALVAGGVTFYVLIALTPSFAALLSIYGLLADPHTIEHQVRAFAGRLLPSDQTLITHQLHQIVSTDPRTLGIGALLGVGVALYTATRGMGGMIDALNIAYGRAERRGLVRFYLTALGLLAGGVLSVGVAVALISAVMTSGISGVPASLLILAGWPVLTLYMIALLALLYRYGPDRADADWKLVSPGAVLAAVLWSVQTILTDEYVIHFGDDNRVYGALGGVMIFLTWLWFSFYLVVLGAEVNGEAERQTR
ncbi:YihY/virulence factor BrkB family protein [Acidiphilium sp.]|uniref:YihY/virulence factor BrkB family protein n=1 Tax=Acidiphilium sp. TaxID=527 RepID=UPI003CFFB3EE